MAYTINANAKNVWIRDNEDTRDLSIQTDASSVYLDNGRTLEQELGEGSMVSNVVTVNSAMSKVIDGTLDGAYESLVFKGKSLVNLASEKTKSFTTSHFLRCTLSHELVNGKKYLLKWDITNNTIGAFDVRFLRTSDGVRSGAFTLNVPKVVTVTNDGFDAIEFFTNASSISQGLTATIDNIMVVEYVEGMENNISYFEGLCDSKMPILMTTGKNLFDYQDFKNTVLSGGATTKYPINLKPNTTYTFSDKTGLWNGGNGYFVDLSLKDENDVLIAKIIDSNSANRKRFTFTTSNSSEYYLFIYQNNMDKMDKASNDFQIEEGSVATPYEPYKTNILRTSEEIVLREVGGVQDTYNALTGEYVQRIGEVVLDGGEEWGLSGFTNDNYFVAYCQVTTNSAKANSKIKCDKIQYDGRVSVIDTVCEGINIIGDKSLRISMSKSRVSNLSDFTSWLQSNPVTIQYELAEPVTSTIEPSTMTPFAYQNGHVILESGHEGQSLLPTLEYSTVVNRTGQVESVAKTIQTQEKQLTMLEQMLIQNIIGLDYNNTVLALNLEINEVM